MTRPWHCRTLNFLVVMCLVGSGNAQEASRKPAPKPEEPHEKLVKTMHSITLGGAKLEYEATAGTLLLKDDDDKPKASMFYVAYTTKSKGENYARRPLTFLFNGGPGSSSVWLHLGAFGPKRIVQPEDGRPPIPPYQLVDNEATLLDLTDLVFVDPVSTGYSRPLPGQDPKQFHGVDEDIRANAAFIRRYVTRFGRWDSPKFLMGESYGTTRVAGLCGYLQDHDGMNFNGVVLISSVLNFGTLRAAEGNDLPYALFLPTYTATAWYHKKLPSDLQADLLKTLAAVEHFAQTEYTLALMKGDALPTADKQQIARKLSRFTGLSEEYALRSNLRIESSRFRKELFRKENRTVGRFDSRFEGSDLDAVRDSAEYDPSYSALQGPYTAMLNQYMRTDLKYETDLPYRILTGKVHPWNYGSARNHPLNMAPTLKQALTKNTGLRVFVANGLYDLATPYFATKYTINHLGLETPPGDRIVMADYPAGHMMYIEKVSREKLKNDLAKFYQGSLKK